MIARIQQLIPNAAVGKFNMHELKITMLGPSGVGKTSLLTAMYEQFSNNIGKANLQLTVDDESEALFQERLIELKSLMDDFEARGGVGATVGEPSDIRSFKFGLGQRGKKPSLELHFQDYPGEYHALKASSDRREFVKNLVNNCVAVLITIDAPSLMEKDGKWHDYINRPQQIAALFKSAYQDLKSPRLVIFAPVRCEKYMQNSKTAAELVQRIKDSYRGLFDLFASDALRSNVAVVITPVQTVGTVIFSRIEDRDGVPHFHFRKVAHDAGYSPQDSEQPLRYLLGFLLKLHLTKRSWGIFDGLRELFSLDKYLVDAVRELSLGCKSTNGFAVVQGEGWLK